MALKPVMDEPLRVEALLDKSDCVEAEATSLVKELVKTELLSVGRGSLFLELASVEAAL